jgi:hypothetical protein
LIPLDFKVFDKLHYYIDRCELWGFISEINSSISHVRYQFFSTGTTLQNCKCGGYVPCCVTVNTHTIVNWKKFREMLLTTLALNQHDVIDVQNFLYILCFFICIFHSQHMNLWAMILRDTAGRICHLENVKSYIS